MKKKAMVSLTIFVALATYIYLRIPDPMMGRASIIAVLGLILWLTELIPFPATTLLLCSAIPLFLGHLDHQYKLPAVLLWIANPVLALFFGGFVMGVAMSRHSLDKYLTNWMLRFSEGKPSVLLLISMCGTAFLSMWMSNVAAAALMIAALRPLWKGEAEDSAVRVPLLLSVAFGANFGGMATPIGSGPNAIAIAAVESSQRITFVQWMIFGVPLTLGMLLLSFVLIRILNPIQGNSLSLRSNNVPLTRASRSVAALFAAAACLWLLEPLHGIPSAVIAVLLSSILFATQLLKTNDLASVDWQTLFLIAGGLVLGELVDRSKIAEVLAGSIPWSGVPRTVMIFAFVFGTSFLSAIASNTASAALLIPFALGIESSPAIAILIAMGASMGAPFVISTPPNAMAYGEGGLLPRHFFIPGLILMLLGCTIITLTGEKVLSAIGIR